MPPLHFRGAFPAYDRKLFKMREMRGAGQVQVRYVPTNDNTSDIFTSKIDLRSSALREASSHRAQSRRCKVRSYRAAQEWHSVPGGAVGHAVTSADYTLYV